MHSSYLKPDSGGDVQLAAETRFLGYDSCSRKVIASSSAQRARKALSLSFGANCVLWFTFCWSFSLHPDSLQVLWWENVILHLSYTLLSCTVISLCQPKRDYGCTEWAFSREGESNGLVMSTARKTMIWLTQTWHRRRRSFAVDTCMWLAPFVGLWQSLLRPVSA